MTTPTSHTINVRDMIESPGFTGPRLHGVTAIMLGATNQESVVELEALDQSDPCNVDGKKQHAMIPFEMLCAGIDAGIFKHTPADELG
jgi:hypothetical protein